MAQPRTENGTITAVPGVRLGHWTDTEAATGSTVLLFPEHGAIAGVEVRGAAPGTRETDLLRPGTLVERVHAIVLTGGSAFGLAAAEGVMRFLEVQGIGFPAPAGPVPIVPAAVIYDLTVGASMRRPTRDAGLDAAREASDAPAESGTVGAGTGATVAKALGMDHAIKGGTGTAAVTLPRGHIVGALLIVNAFGDIMDPATGDTIAGPRRDPADGGGAFESTRGILRSRNGGAGRAGGAASAANTTIGVVATNAPLTVAQANRLAMMAHSGIARAVVPSYGMGDGDTLFAVSSAEPGAPPVDTLGLTTLGAAAAEAVEHAIVDAVRSAAGLAGIPSAAEHIAAARRSPDP